jgi:hypothetical protein
MSWILCCSWSWVIWIFSCLGELDELDFMLRLELNELDFHLPRRAR